MAERSYPHFAFCAPPGVAHKWTAGDTIGGIFGVLLAGGTLGFIQNEIVDTFGGGIGVSCVITIGLIYAAILGVYAFDDWYYHSRLMCIKEAQCTVGTLCGTPYRPRTTTATKSTTSSWRRSGSPRSNSSSAT